MKKLVLFTVTVVMWSILFFGYDNTSKNNKLSSYEDNLLLRDTSEYVAEINSDTRHYYEDAMSLYKDIIVLIQKKSVDGMFLDTMSNIDGVIIKNNDNMVYIFQHYGGDFGISTELNGCSVEARIGKDYFRFTNENTSGNDEKSFFTKIWLEDSIVHGKIYTSSKSKYGSDMPEEMIWEELDKNVQMWKEILKV